MTIMKKIAPYVLALGVGASALTGCATTQMTNRPAQQTEQKEYATIDEAMKVLDVRSSSMIQIVPPGYKISRFDYPILRTLAGIYAGTVEVKRTENGYTADNHNQFWHAGAMRIVSRDGEEIRRASREADANGDKIITTEELEKLAKRVFEENAR